MQALFFIATFLGIYFVVSIFFPGLLFFLPEKNRRRSLAIVLTVICIFAAIVFLAASPAAQVTGY